MQNNLPTEAAKELEDALSVALLAALEDEATSNLSVAVAKRLLQHAAPINIEATKILGNLSADLRGSLACSEEASRRLASGSHAGAAANVRQVILELGVSLHKALHALDLLEKPQSATSRAGYLVALEELIQPVSRPWYDEWDALLAEHFRLTGRPDRASESWVVENRPLRTLLHGPTLNEDGTTPRKFSATLKIDKLVEEGWSRRHAEAILIVEYFTPIGFALNARDQRFAACTYLLVEALAFQAQARGKSGAPLPCALYWNMTGAFGLTTIDPAWANIEVADHTGFRGLVSMGLTKATNGPQRFTKEGWFATGDIKQVQTDSPVVCFESAKAEEGDDTMHAPIVYHVEEDGSMQAAFPPNTLFRLVRVDEAPFKAPTGVLVNQRLLTVRATFRPPMSSSDATGAGLSKLCTNTLVYANRRAFVKGMDDLIARPPLTMELEFSRDITWRDWKGVEYSVRGEWAYVIGQACCKDATPGMRDPGEHAGRWPEGFRAAINAHIRTQRAAGLDTLPEGSAELTLDEVLAVRLYTGPAFQPINEFLRQLGTLQGAYRDELARSPTRSFAATVGHICRAIRKLSAVVSDEEAHRPLYRGVRGELPKKTCVPDSSGLTCLVDMGFMSTSRERQTPISYMGAGQENVLFELLPGGRESDAACHMGADVSMLSQFPHEREVLFPPCTMMVVHQDRSTTDALAQAPGHKVRRGSIELPALIGQLKVRHVTEDEEGKSFLTVTVRPHYS